MQSPDMIKRMIEEKPELAPFKQYLEWAYVIGWEDKSRCPNRRRGVIQINKYRNVIAEYDSLAAAERRTGVYYRNISNCCTSKRHTAGGYHWKHKTI